jgi:membrane-bound inhibitor of C-type lysozyme
VTGFDEGGTFRVGERPDDRGAGARATGVLLRCTACAALVLSGCYYDVQKANQNPMPWGQRVEVACAGGKSMTIDFVPSPRAARVSFDGRTVTLPQVDAASDAKFTDGRYILYVNDQRAALEETGVVLRGPCAPR